LNVASRRKGNPPTRFPAKCNTLISDFLARRLGLAAAPKPARPARAAKRALYLSSPIGLGHARRDLAIARELRALHPELQIDWLAQDPVTRLLAANDETIHPLSARLASETRHIELESGEHELHCFQALRRMDEVLIANFMTFQGAVDDGGYDLVIADEAWDIDPFALETGLEVTYQWIENELREANRMAFAFSSQAGR